MLCSVSDMFVLDQISEFNHQCKSLFAQKLLTQFETVLNRQKQVEIDACADPVRIHLSYTWWLNEWSWFGYFAVITGEKVRAWSRTCWIRSETKNSFSRSWFVSIENCWNWISFDLDIISLIHPFFRVIGIAFMLQILTTKTVRYYIETLLTLDDENSLDCLCRLLTVIGKLLEFQVHLKS